MSRQRVNPAAANWPNGCVRLLAWSFGASLWGCRMVPPTLSMPRMRPGAREKESDENHLHHLLLAGAFLGLFLVRFRVCSLGLVGLRACPGDAGDAGDAGALFGRRRFGKHVTMKVFAAQNQEKRRFLHGSWPRHACVRAHACVCVHAWVRACVRVRTRPRASVRACARAPRVCVRECVRVRASARVRARVRVRALCVHVCQGHSIPNGNQQGAGAGPGVSGQQRHPRPRCLAQTWQLAGPPQPKAFCPVNTLRP